MQWHHQGGDGGAHNIHGGGMTPLVGNIFKIQYFVLLNNAIM